MDYLITSGSRQQSKEYADRQNSFQVHFDNSLNPQSAQRYLYTDILLLSQNVQSDWQPPCFPVLDLYNSRSLYLLGLLYMSHMDNVRYSAPNVLILWNPSDPASI